MSGRVEIVMGMPVSVDVRTPLPERELEPLLDGAFEWLRRVDATFSTYRDDSPVSRLGRGEVTVGDCPPEVAEVLSACDEARERTDGYFDAYAGGRLDPSGYVKGWAVERLSRALAAAGAVDHCVNAGGDVRVRGSAKPGTPWRIGVRDPRRDVVCAVVEARDLAVATSGTYARGAHILDPRTGQPVTGLGSVTVTGPDLSVADMHATALYAMGPGRAPAFAATRLPEGYEALIVTTEGRGLRTPGFRQCLDK